MSHTINRQRSEDLRRLHESNFQLLVQLLPDLCLMDDSAVSVAPDANDLYLHIIERSPYTTVLSLTYTFNVGEAKMPAPDLWIRVCHDASVAEAIEQLDGKRPAHARPYNTHGGLDMDTKWQLNTFMEKWLQRCLQQGHGFACNESYSTSLSV